LIDEKTNEKTNWHNNVCNPIHTVCDRRQVLVPDAGADHIWVIIGLLIGTDTGPSGIGNKTERNKMNKNKGSRVNYGEKLENIILLFLLIFISTAIIWLPVIIILGVVKWLFC